MLTNEVLYHDLEMILFSKDSAGHENEDAVEVREITDYGEAWIGAIADGQGGRFGGARAAQLACEGLLKQDIGNSVSVLSQSKIWNELFKTVDLTVSRDDEAGYTTLVGFSIFDDHVYGASCGDSAAYLLSGNKLIEVTSFQQKNPQIGSGSTSCCFFGQRLVAPWKLLLMTDGVWKYVGRERIETLLRTRGGSELARELELAGRLPGSGQFQDDFTFALLESVKR